MPVLCHSSFIFSMLVGMMGFGWFPRFSTALAAQDSSRQVETADNTFIVPIQGYLETCSENSAIYKKSAEHGWEKVSTDLPARGLYYLDGKFVGYGMCDVVVCTEIPTSYSLRLVEYEQVGERAPPENSGSTAESLPVYNTVALIGAVKIEVNYFGDRGCRVPKTFSTMLQK